MKTTAILDPSVIPERRDTTLRKQENEENGRLAKNDVEKSGAINDNGTLPTRVVSPSQSESYAADDCKDDDDENSRNKKTDSNFKRSNILLTKGESGFAVNEAIRDDDSMGDKTPKREVPSFQPNGDPKTLPTFSLTKPVLSCEKQPPSNNLHEEHSPSKAGMLFDADEEESKGVEKKEETNESEKCKRRYSRQFLAAFAANFGALALGTVLSWTSPALPDMRERKSIGEISVDEATWISTLSLLGAASACPIVGYGIERFGRKRCLLLLTVPFLGGWVLITLAQNIWMIYVGRFLSGFCGGGGSIAIPVYVTETSSANIRGMLASGFDMMLTVGILYIFVIGTFVSWEWQAVACGLLPIVFHLLMMIVPESPTYLVGKGKELDASNALQWLRGASSSQQVETELQELISSVNESKNKSASWKDLLKSSALKPTMLAVSLMIFQQLAAIDAVMFYTVDIFASSGVDVNENLSANIVGAIQVLATITAAVVVDRGGRRLLLLISEVFMVISLGTMGLFFYLKEKNGGEAPKDLDMLPLASLLVYVFAFSIGLGPLPWLLMGELLPLHIKGKASGIVTITRWIMGFLVTFLFQYLMKSVNPYVCYWFFAICCLIGSIFIYFKIPETKGLSLDEVQNYFIGTNETASQTKSEPYQINKSV